MNNLFEWFANRDNYSLISIWADKYGIPNGNIPRKYWGERYSKQEAIAIFKKEGLLGK